jgi:hemerythrin superfamily protein
MEGKNNMDAIELLTSDHRKVETIFQRFEQGLNVQEAVPLFKELYQELTLHALAEENVFYPALARNPEFFGKLKDAFKEHSEVKAAFGELAALDITTKDWLDKMSGLIRNVKHHVRDEENDLFPMARKFLTVEELQELAQQLQKAKELNGQAVNDSLPMKEIDQVVATLAANTNYEGSQQTNY